MKKVKMKDKEIKRKKGRKEYKKKRRKLKGPYE